MATRGSLGGLADATAGLVRLFGAAGRDVVIVETVGVGQAEVAVAQLAAITIVVLVPGMGDDVQAFKAGIMEIADIFVINKADHPGAAQVEREIQSMLSLGHRQTAGRRRLCARWRPMARASTNLMAAIESARGQVARSTLPRPPSQIDHLGIAVKSIDAALGFYERQLGMEVSLRAKPWRRRR